MTAKYPSGVLHSLPRDRGAGHFSFMRLRELRNELPEAQLHGGARGARRAAPGVVLLLLELLVTLGKEQKG